MLNSLCFCFVMGMIEQSKISSDQQMERVLSESAYQQQMEDYNRRVKHQHDEHSRAMEKVRCYIRSLCLTSCVCVLIFWEKCCCVAVVRSESIVHANFT